eukprot:CAMPEP_0196601222 /NCGR_PEP_ID=MMETSP1081-20130531/95797_1 /TAXON_ID=36882 /ORGANISM="Pyramimonas amylifera, Strain CCMP720" /LENGTH=83 /DNA_ID=CAMNT_0041927091 /DNA_START=732 /DNA_END=983 /DNA_ORIENTATION=+
MPGLASTTAWSIHYRGVVNFKPDDKICVGEAEAYDQHFYDHGEALQEGVGDKPQPFPNPEHLENLQTADILIHFRKGEGRQRD